MKKASLISFALFFVITGQALGDDWWWPPTGGAMITPQNPTSSDVVAITLSGEWPHSCTPNDSAILVMGNDIYFDVILDYPPGTVCLTVITPWQRTESVGPLPPGTYTVYARLIGDPFVPEMYLPMAEFTVRGPYYVDDDAKGANDGSSWANAFNYLQDALAVALYGDEIRVAEGTYKPDEDTLHPNGTGDREATFQLINGVALKGGYVGFGELDPNFRDVDVYETVLSGMISGTRSYHVVTGSETDTTAVLDGVTISGGNANGLGEDNHEHGGGMFNDSGSPTLTNCTFTGNYAVSSGGGMLNKKNSNPMVNDCTFVGNSTGSDGGAMYNADSNPRLINCAFIENSAVGTFGSGCGIYNCANSSPMLTYCSFSNNSAVSGGGMYNFWSSSPTLTNCTFQGNSAEYQGGGMRNDTYSSPSLINCTFSGNYSVNSAGGGMYNEENSSPTVTGCTFSGNWADSGGGIFNGYHCNPNVTNCILWGNTASNGAQFQDHETSSPSVNYCDVQGGYPGTENINSDPLFVDADGPDNIFGTEDDNLRLSPVSPCIDAGDNNSVPADTTDLDGDGNTTEPIPWDIDGNPRIVDGNSDGIAVVDMGAYEAPVPPIEVAMKFTPGALNLGSKGKWVKVHCVLPEGYTVEDVDVNTPATLELLGIEAQSEYIDAFVNEDELVEVEIAFGRGAFCRVGTSDDWAEAIVTGSLTSGQRFQGTDAIKIINNKFTCIAVLASYWLEEDCGKPDWCGGADLDQDSIVNFRDFVLFDGCCTEILTQ